jgi:hypothetical protein
MVRSLVGFVALGMAAMALGCGSGISKDDAELRCGQVRTSQSVCVTDAAYQQCVTCQEECGDRCLTLESCPAQFSCPK